MKAPRIIEAAFCADELLAPSSLKLPRNLAKALLSGMILGLSLEIGLKHVAPPFAFFTMGYLFQLASCGIGRVGDRVSDERIQRTFDTTGRMVAHFGNAFVAIGACDLAVQNLSEVSHFPPVTDWDRADTAIGIPAAACCARRAVIGVRALATEVRRYVTDYSNIPG